MGSAVDGIEQKKLRLGSVAPDFEADTTKGPIKFHEYIGNSYAILFSHPEDFTPVCTTELGAVAKLQPEFDKRNVKLIGLSANTLESHEKWVEDINEVSGSTVQYPIIADKSRKVAYLYDMIDYQDTTNVDTKGMALTIRAVFFIDPKKVIRAIIYYPASTGRFAPELLRVIDSLQVTDKYNLVTPVNWQPKDDVIIPVPVSNEKAKTLYPGFRTVKPYLRFTAQPEA